METLLPLIRSLGRTEVRLLRNYILSKSAGENCKRLDLFDRIQNSRKHDEQSIARLLGYSGAGEKAFINLKARLRSDILDMLMLQEDGKAFETAFAQAAFECRRSLIQGEMLLARGVYNGAIEVLENALHLAHRFELHGEFLLIADLLRNHTAVRGDLETFKGLNELMSEAQTDLNRVLRAKQTHYEITVPGLLDVSTRRGYKVQAGELLSQLEEKGRRTNSARIEFYRRLAALNYYTTLHEFPEALRNGRKLLQQVEEHVLLRSDANRAGVNMELAGVCLNTGDYGAAVTHAQTAVELFKPGMVNHMQALLILFFALFRSGDATAADKTLDQALAHRQAFVDPVMEPRINLLRSGLQFSKGEYKESVKLLRRCGRLQQERDVWLPGCFLMDTLNDYEQQRLELIACKLDAFRKQAVRLGLSRSHEHSRLRSIVQVMTSLVRARDLAKLMSKEKDQIALLRTAEGDYHWNPAGYELIRFDEWLLKKAV